MPPGTVSGQRLPSSALEMYRSTGTGAAVVVAASVAPSSDPPQAAASGRSSRETATRAERARTDGILHLGARRRGATAVHRRFAGAAEVSLTLRSDAGRMTATESRGATTMRGRVRERLGRIDALHRFHARFVLLALVGIVAVGVGAGLAYAKTRAAPIGTGVVVIETNLAYANGAAAGTGMLLTS